MDLGRLLGEALAISWQGTLMAPVLLGLFAAGVWLWYQSRWETKNPNWQEAIRDWWSPRMQIERWIRFRWIHPDTLYWIAHVRFDQGPLVLEGQTTDALYWSFTYYASTEVNDSISSRNIVVEPGTDRFRIHFAQERPAEATNFVKVRPDAKKGVIYFRIYEPAHLYPSRLPRVSRGGRVLIERVDT
ncbi:MAG: hypothetical protein H6738_01785 [Alphaproteobacteria bacterium]|nr:hypothetical protein [Alphaproteobacteria bacterium]MCB9695499.1 hypothetical protein [Alphaproteobacteria bacterium]